jgi:type VI secretion system protein ImpD
MSQIAAAAFAPFVVGADPVLLGVDEFSELEIAQQLPRTFEQVEYVPWNALRGSDDARFLGVVLPRVLMRTPHDGLHSGNAGFPYREDVGGADRSKYLWGNAVYAFGSVLIRAFADCGWLADIRGAPTDGWSGGLVDTLPVHSFATDAPGVAPKYTTDVLITDDREKELADLGLIGLCHLRGTRFAAFFSNQSLQRPQRFDTPAANTNARLSAMLQYLFCVARFAHYLKVMARDQVGKLTTPAECEQLLQRWVLQYCTAADDLGLETRARYPLSEANVSIKEHPGRPGRYLCVMHLKPHFQLDQVVSAVRLVTELAPIQV